MKPDSPAIIRGQELMSTPMGKLPPTAQEFIKVLAKKHGMCGEVCMTALTDYAQIVEGLECTDDLYICRDKSIYAGVTHMAVTPPEVNNRLDNVT